MHPPPLTFFASLPVLPSSIADRVGWLGLREFARFLALAGLGFTPDVPSSLLSASSDSPPDCPDSSAPAAEPAAAARLRLPLPAVCRSTCRSGDSQTNNAGLAASTQDHIMACYATANQYVVIRLATPDWKRL